MQCLAPPHVEADNFAEFWASQERHNSEALQNKKLRVIYNIASPEELPALLEKAAANEAAAGTHRVDHPAIDSVFDVSPPSYTPFDESSNHTQSTPSSAGLPNTDPSTFSDRSLSKESHHYASGVDNSDTQKSTSFAGLSNPKSQASDFTAQQSSTSSVPQAPAALQKKIVDTNNVPLVQALAFAFITFLIGWYFF